MSLTLDKCDFCKHLNQDEKTKYCCDAFPDGIPDEAMNAEEIKECNNGIKFEEE